MQLSKLLTGDDRAVSPVIGVILMVAITVILAAVIASFVLGLGGEQEVAPKHTFTFDYDSGSDLLTITSRGGDPIRHDELIIRGNDLDSSISGDQLGGSNNEWPIPQASGTIEGSTSAVVAGDTLDVGVTSSYTVSVVWESVDTSTSSELASHSGPDA